MQCGSSDTEAPTAMKYTNYKVLVCCWGVELIGWTEPKIYKPGKLTTAISLNRLLQALRSGDRHWAKLTELEWAERIALWDAGIADGKGKQRATHSDKSKLKKWKRNGEEFKSTETVRDSDDEEDDDSGCD